MAIAYSVRVGGGGTDSFHGFEDYSRVTRVSGTSCGSSSEPAVFVQFWLCQCRMVLRPPLSCLPSRFTVVRYLYWFLGLCGIGPEFSVAFAPIARTIPATVLVLALHRVADVATFSPIPRFLR